MAVVIFDLSAYAGGLTSCHIFDENLRDALGQSSASEIKTKVKIQMASRCHYATLLFEETRQPLREMFL